MSRPGFPSVTQPILPSARPGRNLTGLYVGGEWGEHGGIPPPRHKVPPLARGRGMPSHRIRTPTEDRRYRKVEMLRVRENKLGFSGNQLKRKAATPGATEQSEAYHRHEFLQQKESTTFWDITKQTERAFTAATNSGVTHLEYLCPASRSALPDQFEQQQQQQQTVLHEIDLTAHAKKEVTGLVECYKKVCKGTIDGLIGLLRSKKTSPNKHSAASSYTGFSVKSYRNPVTGELSTVLPRPCTVIGNTDTRSPQCPSPFFFKTYQPCKSGTQSEAARHTPYEDEPYLHTSGCGTRATPQMPVRNTYPQPMPSPRQVIIA